MMPTLAGMLVCSLEQFGSALARFHFDCTNGEWCEFDAAVAELPNITAVHRHARALAQDFVSTHSHGAPDWYGWSVEVMDDAGRPVLSMPFRSAVRSR